MKTLLAPVASRLILPRSSACSAWSWSAGKGGMRGADIDGGYENPGYCKQLVLSCNLQVSGSVARRKSHHPRSPMARTLPTAPRPA
jgi:hypothetical protein